jgi:hypothetical protein
MFRKAQEVASTTYEYFSATKMKPSNDVSLIKLKNVLPKAGIETRIA